MSTNRLQRTHRSTKIPNVKLRPVPVSTASRERQRADAEDDAHFQATRDHGTTRGAHTAQDFLASKPLQGVVLSFTGITDEKLGARVHKNLTSEVTHLVARQPGSEKYKCAVRFHMHVVRPEWLYLVREAWLAGEDAVDIAQLADESRLGALEGMHVALSGVDERIHEQGGTLAPRLSLDGSLTHLACGPDDGRIRKSYTRVVEQQALARHYTTDALPAPIRAAAAIKLVHVEWIDECCDTGTMLPEDEYDARAPLAPRPPRPQPPPRIPMAERTISAPAPAAPPQKDLARLVHRIHSQTEPGLGQAPKRTGLLALTRAERFGQEAPKLFAQRTFHVAMADDARTRRVASAIRGAGGVLVAEQDAMYTVRPLVGGRGAGQCVTHHWVELCLHYDRLVDPKAYVASEPTRAPMPVPGADAVRFSFTGVDREGPEYHHALAAIHAIGASVEDAMSRARTTHLVAEGDARHGVKAQKAAAWGVPVVGYEFLQKVLRTGRLRETSDVPPPPPPPPPDASDTPDAEPTPEPEQDVPSSQSWWAEPDEQPQVMYDDPAARKERTRLLALVDGHPAKKARR